MIARMWRATATEAGARLYEQHFRGHVLPSLSTLNGYAGGMLLKTPSEQHVELLVISFWASESAIRAFAGSDVRRAVVAEEASRVLETYEDIVTHFTVATSDRLEFGGD
jgi:heme-degrading monooxygenase HmoA